MAKVGRPSDYNKKTAEEICVLLQDGKSLREICDMPNMPSRPTVFRWIHSFEEFRNKYEHARDVQADVLTDEMDHIANNEEDVQRARLIIDTRKWTASKLKPKKYGDKLDVEHGGNVTISFHSSLNQSDSDSGKA